MAESGVEQWDLTAKISPYLDRHMMFPLLENVDALVSSGGVSYQSKDVAAARLALLRPTHMVDYAIDIYKTINGENATIPKEMEDQKVSVYERLEELKTKCKPFDDLCSKADEKATLVGTGKWNVDALAKLPGSAVTAEVIEAYRELAKYKFDCGDYKTSRDMLENYISLFAHPPKQSAADKEEEELTGFSNNNKQQQQQHNDKDVGKSAIYYLKTVTPGLLEVIWGKLACEIMVEDWEAASVAVDAVKFGLEAMVSSNQIPPLKALSQRTWLLHWSLFVYWNNPAKGGLEQLIELFHTERFKQAITTNAPHLLRYLTAAVLLCKRHISKKAAMSSTYESRRLLKNLINVMQDCEYSDPIVEFVNCLCVKFDFESAQTKLEECKRVLSSDFFLCKQTDLFMEEARVFVFENYCRIHNKIDLTALGEKLAMNREEAERWIVDLIRNADLDAKIDAAEGCVVMGGSVQSVYEQVMERTRDLNVRSAALAQNMNNMIMEAKKEAAKRERSSRDDME